MQRPLHLHFLTDPACMHACFATHLKQSLDLRMSALLDLCVGQAEITATSAVCTFMLYIAVHACSPPVF
jgi:hypothetical protein